MTVAVTGFLLRGGDTMRSTAMPKVEGLTRFKNHKANVILSTYHKSVDDSELNFMFSSFQELCDRDVWCQLSEIPIAIGNDDKPVCKYSVRFVVGSTQGQMALYSDFYKVFDDARTLSHWIYDIQSILKVFMKGGSYSRCGGMNVDYDVEVEYRLSKGSDGCRWQPVEKVERKKKKK